jgi:hypothetical protein
MLDLLGYLRIYCEVCWAIGFVVWMVPEAAKRRDGGLARRLAWSPVSVPLAFYWAARKQYKAVFTEYP